MARSAETKTQLIRKAKLKTSDKTQGKFAPYFGFVQAYSADSEEVLVDSHGGRRPMAVPQPHLGQSAWMRAAPEGGMGSLMIMRSDAQEPEVMRWWDVDTGQRLRLYRQSIENLISGNGRVTTDEAFRFLESGEIDIQSKGGSAIYMGSRPHMDMRAGIIRLVMDQDEAEFMTKSPLHVRRGHKNKENEIGDEERFGVVRRMRAGSFVDRFFPNRDGGAGSKNSGFAKEYLMKLANGSKEAPESLLDIRMGNVMDDTGSPVSLAETGINLRVDKEYFTTASTSVKNQIDENGNFKIEHPNEATYGGLFVLPTGSMRARIGGNFTRNVGRNETAVIAADNVESIGNDKTSIIGSNYNLIISNDETKAVARSSNETVGLNKSLQVTGNSDETVLASKTIKVGGTLVIQTGSGNLAGFSSEFSALQAKTVTILATQEIVFEAPRITFNTPVANFTGAINANGPIATNGGLVAPSSSRGNAGTIAPSKAIQVPGI